MSVNQDLLNRFILLGLDEKQAQQAAVSDKTSKNLLQCIADANNLESTDNLTAQLFFDISTSLPQTLQNYRPMLIRYILDKRIKSKIQLQEALKYIKKHSGESEFNVNDFESASGVGIVLTEADVKLTLNRLFQQHHDTLVAERYKFVPKLLGVVNTELKWADSLYVKQEFDKRVLNTIASRTAEDDAKPSKPSKAKPASTTNAATTAPSATSISAKASSSNQMNGDVTANGVTSTSSSALSVKQFDDSFVDEGRDIIWSRNTPEQLERNRLATGGKMLTRFPPEPNGFLHIGHAKAMNFNFGIAKRNGGATVMRFDDTNPEAEKQIYIDNILENMQWLGHQPCKVTFSSDYFDELFDFAVKLIKKGKAYVDHQTAAEIKQSRSNNTPSPWRDRPIEENLKLFYDMKNGKFDEGTATLRLKGDLTSPNPQISGDIVAYRIKYVPHPHIGNKWCIYPSYDFTHCIIDSLENITHSLCTLEFEVRRESYYWLLYELDLYKPKVWEYSRLNIEHFAMSKRKLLQLVNDGYVTGWDDPRMMTVNGLRRRGYTPEAINDFCDRVGVTRNANMIPMTSLEHCARQHLDQIAVRHMVVENPVPVTLTNYPDGEYETIEVPDFPKEPDSKKHTVTLSRTAYIDAADVKLQDVKDYYGLAPNKTVRLKYAYNITCTAIDTESAGKITHVHATVDRSNGVKTKGMLHWVSSKPHEQPQQIELRLYDNLFKSADLSELGDDWLSDINPYSLQVVPHALADRSFTAHVGDRFQFERLAYFVVDPDTEKQKKLIFNRVVPLKEDKAKLAVKEGSAKTTR